MTPFALAVRFLTRLPVPGPVQGSPEDLGRSVVSYPLVGLGIGIAAAAVGWILSSGPVLLAASLVVAFWAGVTGFLHLDGLADSADAWLGGFGDPGRTLAILDDSRAGTAGVVMVGLVLLIKVTALAALIGAGRWIPLILAPALARAGAVVLLLTSPYVRAGGLGETPGEWVPRGPAWIGVALAALALLLLEGGAGVLALILGGLGLLALRALFLRRLGGMVGDGLGAAIELGEALVLAVLVYA